MLKALTGQGTIVYCIRLVDIAAAAATATTHAVNVSMGL